MALSKAEGLRCASSFVIAAYFSVRLIPQDLRALQLDFFLCRLISTFHNDVNFESKKTRPPSWGPGFGKNQPCLE